jgi:hypothetical protein
MTQTTREKVAASLQAARTAGDDAAAGRLQGELNRLNKINEEAAPVVAQMERRQQEQRQAEERAATQLQNKREREFKEALDKHYQDRLGFYRQTWPGLPKADFDRDIWPELRRQFMVGKEDAVDRERREAATFVF